MLENDGFDSYLAARDQGIKGMQDLADLHAAHFLRLVEQGVPEEQAGRITSAYVVASTPSYRRD